MRKLITGIIFILCGLVTSAQVQQSEVWRPITGYSGNGHVIATVNGAATSGDGVEWDANGNLVDTGSPSGSSVSGITTSMPLVGTTALTCPTCGVTGTNLSQFASGGAINPSSTGATTPGTGAFKTLGNIAHVDPANLAGWTGSDYGAWVTAAIGSLPTASGHPIGQVVLDPPATAGASSIAQTTEVSLDLTYLSVIGPKNPAVLQITCSISAVCWNTFTSSSIIPNRSGTVGGFTLIGVGTNASAIGMQSGGCWYGCTFENLTIQGFTGASAIGWLWSNPAGTQSERVTINNVQLGSWGSANTTDLKFVDVNSADDFDYWNVQSLRMTVGNTDTGIDLENDSVVSGNWNLTINTNATSGTTYVFKVNGTSQFGSVGGGAGAAVPFPPAVTTVDFNLDGSASTGNVTVWTVASGAYVGIDGPVKEVAPGATWSNAIATASHFVNFSSGLVAAPVVLTAQAADLSYIPMYTVPSTGGIYEMCIEMSETRAATTTSAMPPAGVAWSRKYDDFSDSYTFTAANTANAQYVNASGCYQFNSYPGSAIQYYTSGYASSGATAMQFGMTVTLRLIQ
jgi:hypothetical protein